MLYSPGQKRRIREVARLYSSVRISARLRDVRYTLTGVKLLHWLIAEILNLLDNRYKNFENNYEALF
jgi:hypothetical protein